MKAQIRYDTSPPQVNRTGASNLMKKQVGRSLFIRSTELYKMQGTR